MRAAPEACGMLNLFEHERTDAHAVVVGMDGYFLHKQRPHAALFEVSMIHPAVCAADLMRVLRIPNQFEFFTAVDFKEQLLDTFIFIGLYEALFMAWTLEFDRLAVYTAKHHLQKLPNAIDIAPMHAADVQLDPDIGVVVVVASFGGAHHVFWGWHRHFSDLATYHQDIQL